MSPVTFVVPVKNDAARLIRCLDSIERSAGGSVDVIVADNGSTDGTPDAARSRGAHVLGLPGLRVSELRNQAATEATSGVIAFVDADHEISDGWLAAARTIFEDASIGAAGALYTAPPNGTWVQRSYGLLRGETKGSAEASWLGSGNLLVRRSAFEQIGGFDVRLEACEDVDLCQRLRAAGWRVVADERLRSIHLGDPPTLTALFRAERWRGRDNLRVSLRGPLTLRELPGIVMPALSLVGIAMAVFGVAAATAGLVSWWIPLAAIVVILGLSALRTLRIASRARTSGIGDLVQAFGVALTYDTARALALVTRAPHHRKPAPSS